MEVKIDKLPKNWVKKQSKSRPDKFYYFNTASGVSSWTVPKGENDKTVTSPKKDSLRGISANSKKAGKNLAEKRLSKLQVSLVAEQTLKDKQIVADLKVNKAKQQVEKPKESKPRPDANSDVKPTKTSPTGKKRKVGEQKITVTKPIPIPVEKSFKIPKKAKEKEAPRETKSAGQRILAAITSVFSTKKVPEAASPSFAPKFDASSDDLEPSKTSTAFSPKTPVSTAVFGLSSQRLNRFRESLTSQQEETVTEDVDLDVSMDDTTIDEEDEMMDWETIPEEVILKEIKEIRELTPDHTVTSLQPPTSQAFQAEIDTVYIVVDTNVFLSHLQFIESFSQRKLININRAKLIVPYTVLQELDKIKHRRTDELATVASRVIRFLNEKFSKSEQWIQGQNPMVANNKKLIEILNPDDNILNCCLQLKQETSKVMLLSNDVNLRNKALFSAVFACSKSQFEYEADDLHSRFS